MQLSCVWVSVTQLLELFHCCKRASAELQSLLPLFIVIGHMCQRVRKMQSKYVLWKSNSLEKSPTACAMVWIVASDRSTHSRASSHTPMRCAEFAVCRIPSHAQRATRKMSPSSSTKKKTPSGDSMYRHALLASISKGKSRQQ